MKATEAQMRRAAIATLRRRASKPDEPVIEWMQRHYPEFTHAERRRVVVLMRGYRSLAHDDPAGPRDHFVTISRFVLVGAGV